MNTYFNNLSDEQIIQKKHLIPNSSDQLYIFKNILSRTNNKKIFNEVFGYFLLNPNRAVLERIFNIKYVDIFSDLIKENIEDLIKISLKKETLNMLIGYGLYNLVMDNFTIVLESENSIYGIHEMIGSIHDEELFFKYGNEMINALSKQVNGKHLDTALYKKLIDIMFCFIEKEKSFNYVENEDKLLIILDSIKNSCGYENSNYMSEDALNLIFSLSRKSTAIEKYVEENIDMITCIFLKTPKELLEVSDSYPKKVNMLNYYSTLIKDILKEEKVSLKDVYCSCGSFSEVLIIGNKVLKVGSKFTKHIPYDKRFLMPLIRTDAYHGMPYKDGYFEKGTMLEVYERVDTSNISDDDCYEIFMELLKKGILWADAKPDNLGRLLEPNSVYLSGAYKKDKNGKKMDYYVDNKSVYMYKINDDIETLGAGELVIIDLDSIYDIRKLDVLGWINKEIEKGFDISKEDVSYYIFKNTNDIVCTQFENWIDRYLNELKKKIR